MGNMRFKVGDRVRIKSIDWYNANKNIFGKVWTSDGHIPFEISMSVWCGKVMTISFVGADYYTMVEDLVEYWADEMIEGFAEDLLDKEIQEHQKICDEALTIKGIEPTEEVWHCPEGYQFKDENGNVINTQKIVLEKKHDGKLKLESIKRVREYWSEYARIFIEIYDDEPNECVFTHLSTLEGYRKKGYGKQALSEAESIAKKLGCHTAYLKVETDSWMHQWYLRCGYNWYKNADEGYTWLIKEL